MTPEKAIVHLKGLLEANRIDDALAFVSSLEEKQLADSGAIHCMRGSVYDCQGELRLAEGEYRKALGFTESMLHREALYRHANALDGMGETHEALQQAQRLVHVYPGFVEGHSQFGQLLHDSGRYDEALPYLESAHRADPNDPRLCWVLVRSYYFAGFLVEGRSKLDQVLGANEDNWDYLEVLAYDLNDADLYESALDAFCCLLEGRPHHSAIVPGLMFAANELNELEKAESIAKSLVGPENRPVAAILTLAEVALEREHNDEAAALLKELHLRMGEKDWAIQSLAARLALKEARYPDAYRIATEVLKRHDDLDIFRGYAGAAACALEMDREAVELLRSYFERNEPEAWLKYNLGCSELMLGNFAEACTEFEYCLEQDPEDFRSRLVYAQVLHQLGRLQEAKQQYEMCLSHDSIVQDSLYGLMFLLDETGDKDGSKKIADHLVDVGYNTDMQDFQDLVRQDEWQF